MILAVDIIPVLLVAGLTALVVSTAAMAAETLAARRSERAKKFTLPPASTVSPPRGALSRTDEQDLSPSAAALLGKARSNAASAVRAAADDLGSGVDAGSARPAVGASTGRTGTSSGVPDDVSAAAFQQAIFDNLSPAEAAEFATFVADSDPERVAGVLREWLSNDDTSAPFTSPVVRDDRKPKGA